MNSAAGRSVLADPDSDRRLRRDGFVHLPLLSRETAFALRHAYGELRGWAGEGFAPDMVLDDVEYRRAADAVIADALDEQVQALYIRRRPFMRTFLCKYGGETSELYLHRDWMYVDERAGGRTYNTWIALDDIDGDNGQLRVLRGSHRIDSSIRGTELVAPWLRHEEIIRPRLLSIPVRAGDCVIFDNALVHCSYPNLTDTPRLVVAVGMRSIDTPLVHFRRLDDGASARYDVDEEFFLSATPQGLISAPPDLPVAEEISTTALDLDAIELARRLDRGLLARSDRARQWATRSKERSGVLAARARVQIRSSPDRFRAVIERTASSPEPADRSAGTRLPRPKGRLAKLLSPGDAGTTRATDTSGATLRERATAFVDDLPTKAAIAVLGLNEASIGAFGPATPAVWDPEQFDWARRVEAGYPDVRREVEALLRGPVEIPHIEDVTGGIPQGNEGAWRSFVLMHQGRWMDWNCRRCPLTTELVRSIPGLTMAGFSVLEPGAHITEHRGPNKGALRYQLGVIVPGDDGDCRIRVGDDMLVWRDGEGVMFDFTFPHEAWNDSDGIRVLLMLEVITPGLPWYLATSNRLAQRAMGWFPTTRDMTRRLKELEPKLSRAEAERGRPITSGD